MSKSDLEDTFACEDWADLRGEAKNINGEFIGKEVREVAGYYTPEEVLELLSEVVSFRTVSASDEQAK